MHLFPKDHTGTHWPKLQDMLDLWGHNWMVMDAIDFQLAFLQGKGGLKTYWAYVAHFW